jgi:hypothetical protein
VPAGDTEFESLLEQVRGLHRLADELTYSTARFNEHLRARLNWDVNPPSLPPEQRELADQILEVLGTQRLSSSQSRELYRILFGR